MAAASSSASSSATTSGLNSFLAAAKGRVAAVAGASGVGGGVGGGGLHVSIGNEAGDADSLVSAICHSYVKDATTSTTADAAAFEHVPVLSIPRGDFKLRPETSELMALAGLSTEHLCFVDELELSTLAQASRLRLSLVDHNQLAPKVRHAPTETLPTPPTNPTDQPRRSTPPTNPTDQPHRPTPPPPS